MLLLRIICKVFVASLYLPLAAIGQPQSTRNYACRIIASFTRLHVSVEVGKVCSAAPELLFCELKNCLLVLE